MIPFVEGTAGFLSGVLSYFMIKNPGNLGANKAIRAYHENPESLTLKEAFTTLFTSAMVLGSGGPSGREGAVSMVGGSVGVFIAKLLRQKPHEVREALAIGVGAGLVTYGAALLRVRMKLDDSLDVWAVHGMGGMWGAIATGIFADVGAVGLLYGGVHQFLVQLLGVAAVGAYVFTVSLVLFKVIDRAFGFTVARHEEAVGLDLSEHGETAYPEL